MYVLNGTKIAQGDLLERQKLLFLVNPAAYKILANKQGVKTETLHDVEKLVNSVQNGEVKFNFNELMRLIPIKSTQIAAGNNRFKILSEKELGLQKRITR